MRAIFALMALGLVACGPEKDDTGESPEADADADADTDTDTDTDGDADLDTGCADDSPVPEEWPEVIDDADVHFGWGYPNAALGDVDGDGHDDIALYGMRVLLGPFCQELDPWVDGIAAVLYSGSSESFPRLVGAGDVDGDDLDDLWYGNELSDDGGGSAGEVFLVLSPVEGEVYVPAVAVADIVGETEGGYLGGAVAGVGDVDGDGVPDLLAGAEYEDDDGGLRNGAAWLFPGTTRGYHAVSEVGVAIRGSEEFPTVGYNLAALGDTDGDGLADFLVGTSCQIDRPAVALVRGPVEADLAFEDADAVFLPSPEEEVYGGGFGASIAGVGDQDGDGLSDVAIGAPWSRQDSTTGGVVFICSGADNGTINAVECMSVIRAENSGDSAGWGVDLAGDVNGDGQADLVVGAPGWSGDSSAYGGAVYVILGSVPEGSMSLAEADARVAGTYDEAAHDLGYDNIGAGDTNGDGLDDVLMMGWMEAGWSNFLHSHLLLGRE